MQTKLNILKLLYPSSAKGLTYSYKIASYEHKFIEPKFRFQIKRQVKNSMNDIFYGEEFAKRKKELLKDIRRAGFWGIGDIIAKRLQKISSPKDLFSIYENIFDFFYKQVDKRINFLNKRKSLIFANTNQNATIKRIDGSLSNITSAFYRFFTPETKNPQIKKIENAIRKMGVQEVRLGNNLEDAQTIYNGIKIAFKNKDKLPTRIFVPIIPDKIISSLGGFCENFANNTSNIVLTSSTRLNIINSSTQAILNGIKKRNDFLNLPSELQEITKLFVANNNFSTKLPTHNILHEIGHTNQKVYLPKMNLLALPEKDIITIQNLTDYCYHDDVLTEAFAELYAKIRGCGIDSLTKDELNLWKRMNSGYFTSYEKKLKREIRKQNRNF